MLELGIVVIPLATAIIMLPMLNFIFAEIGFVNKNHRNQMIPQGMGLIFLLSYLPSALWMIFFRLIQLKYILLMLILIISMALLGLIDDRFGNKQVQGFKGHFHSFFKEKKLTTGIIKALFGFLVAFIISAEINGFTTLILINTLIIVLSANTFNLFDLRPGRTIKVFMILSLVLLMISSNISSSNKTIFLLLPFFSIFIYYIPLELEEKAMMGDTGANLLGGVIGYYAVISLGLYTKVGFLLFMIGLQFINEYTSFSEVISRNRILLLIDNLGRNCKQ